MKTTDQLFALLMLAAWACLAPGLSSARTVTGTLTNAITKQPIPGDVYVRTDGSTRSQHVCQGHCDKDGKYKIDDKKLADLRLPFALQFESNGYKPKVDWIKTWKDPVIRDMGLYQSNPNEVAKEILKAAKASPDAYSEAAGRLFKQLRDDVQDPAMSASVAKALSGADPAISRIASVAEAASPPLMLAMKDDFASRLVAKKLESHLSEAAQVSFDFSKCYRLPDIGTAAGNRKQEPLPFVNIVSAPYSEKISAGKSPLALDAFAMVANPQNPIRNLTSKQVADIYSGKITQWADLGWEEGGAIVPLWNINNQLGFQQTALRGEEAANVEVLPSSAKLAAKLKATPAGIGFVSKIHASTSSLATLAIDDTLPTDEYIVGGLYPFTVGVYVDVSGAGPIAEAEIAKFTNSKAASDALNKAGLVPVASAIEEPTKEMGHGISKPMDAQKVDLDRMIRKRLFRF